MKKTELAASYKWVIVAILFLCTFVGLGFLSSNKSLFLTPVTEALNFKRSAYTVGDSLRYVATIITNCFFGVMIARFGTKKLLAAGVVSLIASSVMYTVGEKLYHFYIAGALMGVGFSWTSTTMVGCVINKWFTEKKGTITGALLCANGIGGAASAQVLTNFIYEEGNPFGFRNAYMFITISLLVVLLLVVLFFKDKPDFVSETGKKTRTVEWEGIEADKALRSGYFYGVAICLFVSGMILQGAEGMVAALLKDRGFAAAFVATIISIRSLALTGTKLLSDIYTIEWGLRFRRLFVILPL